MKDFSEIGKYLPTYLSQEASKNLFSELENFPDNIDSRLYTNILKETELIYQGDGISGLLSINLPDIRTGPVPGMVLSNTCDIDEGIERVSESRLVFSTIFQLEKYQDLLLRKYVETGLKNKESIMDHIQQIRNQYISHIFFLPAGGFLQCDSIALFDRVNNLPNNIVKRSEIQQRRLFTLSDYGFYLFLYKLSIHFTRIRENIIRGPI